MYFCHIFQRWGRYGNTRTLQRGVELQSTIHPFGEPVINQHVNFRDFGLVNLPGSFGLL